MLNCAVIMGRLVADPELRTTPNGISVTSLCVAVDRSFVKAGEERKADFINVVAWRQTADFVTRYFHTVSYTHLDVYKRQPDRLEMNKYCPFCKKHTLHRETK